MQITITKSFGNWCDVNSDCGAYGMFSSYEEAQAFAFGVADAWNAARKVCADLAEAVIVDKVAA